VGVGGVTGQEVTKASYLADVGAKNSKAEPATISDMKVQVFGNVAVVTGVSTTVNTSYKGQDRSGKYRWIDKWVRRGGA
jgi:ketosteroid isomerase-like protein